MRYARFIISSSSLLFAGFILFISLSAGNSRMIANRDDFDSSEKHFYISQTILPDHVAYPVLMTLDKAKLKTASPTQHVYLQIEYAERRFVYAQKLLEKQNSSLALTTLTKAQKYLLQAAREALQPEMLPEIRVFVLKKLEYYALESTKLQSSFIDADQVTLNHHAQELRMLKEELQRVVSEN